MLAQFPADPQHRDVKRAIRAGLRMQRAMAQFTDLLIAGEHYSIRGLSEQADRTPPEALPTLIQVFARLFARINAATEAQGGILKKITYHLVGSDMMIYFGVPHYYQDNALRAATACSRSAP